MIPLCAVCAAPMKSTGRPADVEVWRCPVCGARRSHPVPQGRELTLRYETEHDEGKWGELFETQIPAELARRADLISKLAVRIGSVLDVGCGDGRFLDAARGQGWTTTGLELALPAARAVKVRRHRVAVAEIAAIDHGAAFEAITFWDVLEHVADPLDALGVASILLAKGGLVAATMPNVVGTSSRFAGRGWPYYDFATYGHMHHLSPTHLKRMMERVGLQTAYVETTGSVDLRSMWRGEEGAPEHLGWLLDKASGVLARIAAPLRRGNTILIVGRKP